MHGKTAEIGEGDGFDLDSVDLPLDEGPALDVDGAAGLEPPAED